MGFPGRCDRCGGPQVWTHHAGDVWVACKHDCLDEQLDAFGRNPPLIALCAGPEETPKMEHQRGGGVGLLEDGDGRMSDKKNQALVALPPGFLDVMWEGSVQDG